MDSPLENIHVFYRRITSTQFPELPLCLLFLKINQLRIIFMPEAYFGSGKHLEPRIGKVHGALSMVPSLFYAAP